MNLAQVKKLKIGDKFRKPSTNGHDNGFCVYTVTGVADTGILSIIDQHGYRYYISLMAWKSGNKEFMESAEMSE